MRRIALTLCLFFCTVRALAQEPLSGTVLDDAGKPLAGANVVAYAANSKVLSYAITGADGVFRLNKTDGLARISVSFIGFKTADIKAESFRDGQSVKMQPGGFQLKEVAVTAERIKETGDTLTYSVGGFKQAQDRSIADVIGKMPGLEVKSDGAIEYQGKPINKFYIEGKDLMGGQYSLASENLPADKVKEVQVLENHEPVKSLRGTTFNEQAALNIVLKDEAKSVWTGLADLGGGYGDEWLYDSRLMGMQFGKRVQALMLYKNNNTGKDIGTELKDLADLNGYRPEEGWLDLISLDGPDFDRERYTFNASHLFAGNWLWNTGKDSQLRLQASGFLDRELQRSSSRTTYLTIDGLPALVEDLDVTGRRRQVKGEVDYTLNASKTYLRSQTKVNADWDDSNGRIVLDGLAKDLMVKPGRRSISEDLSISHTTGAGHIWQVQSSTGYTSLPGRLLRLDGARYDQDLKVFSSENFVSRQYYMGRWQLTGKAGLEVQRQQMNGHRWNLLKPYLEPGLQRKAGSHQLDGTLRVGHQGGKYDDTVWGRLLLEPAIHWSWKISPTSTVIAQYSLSADPLTGKQIIDEPVYVSYRSQYVGTGHPDIQLSHSFYVFYTYKNPVNGLFLSLLPLWALNQGNLLTASEMNSGVYQRRATGQVYDASTYLLDGRASKSFTWARMVLGLSGSASLSDYSYLLNGDIKDARSESYSLSADYSLRPVRWMTVQGRSGVVYSRRNAEDMVPIQVNDWEHRLQLNILPAKGWMVSWQNELYHSSERDFGVNWFSDLSVSYKADRWEVSLIGNNIVGTSQYERIRVSSTVQSYTLTHLRPREILFKVCWDL